ncbi:hypothetical protein DF3PA_70109 [Candidatus Defluviicoccus seviourii]|uniref:RNA polymerase sigma-70 region 2 domain-containing protein n=1 Tax=Candidatus Defluviicoccus seviourii TaxID=2565273 RepID=A0A564WIL3_9PROT|nr:hypothetical protein DF3PA_70109 [Candidatus Defluviicoccus seviourii]
MPRLGAIFYTLDERCGSSLRNFPRGGFFRSNEKKKYLNNQDLLTQLQLSHERGAMTPELGRMFLKLVEKISKRPNWCGYTYLEEMQSTALINLCAVWQKFDMTKTNPFAYFTTCVTHSFLQELGRQKKQQHVKELIAEAYGLPTSFAHHESAS